MTTIASPSVDAGPGQAIVVGNGTVGITNTLIVNYAAGIETAGSPTIDAGVDAGVMADLEGVTRPQYAGYDIGAFEFDDHLSFLPVILKDR